MFVAVIVLASAAFVAGLAGQTKASERWDAAFAEANGAHVTIDGRELDTLAAVAGRPDVAAASAPYRRTSQELDILRDGRAVTTVYVREMAGADLPAIATPLLRDGRWAGPGTDDEIVIDRAFGLEEGIDVGDAISLSTPTGSRSFTVVGRAVDFVDCFYPNCTPVTTWLEPAGFATLGVATVNTVFLLV